MSQQDSDDQIAAVRAFNRFYTRKLGVLDQQLLKSPFSLSEARVLYELANRENPAAKEIGIELGLDPGYLSRIIQNFDDNGLITRKPLASDRRQYRLGLTAKGRQAFAKLDRSSHDDVADMLATLPAAARTADRGDGRDRTAARHIRRFTSAGDPARAPSGRHGMGGAEPWRALCQRIRLRRLVRGPGRGDRGKIPRLVRRLAGTLLDRRHRRRPGRLGISGQAQRRCRQTAVAAGRSGRARTGPGPAAGRRMHRFARPAAIARSRCGPRASWSPRARFIRMPASCWWPPNRTAVSAKA